MSISFGNPHMHLQLRNAQGLWEVDLSPPIVAQGSGFGPAAAKAGDQVVLTGRLMDLLGTFGEDWNLLTAGAFISIVVPLIVFFSLQRYFVRGLLAGSVK